MYILQNVSVCFVLLSPLQYCEKFSVQNIVFVRKMQIFYAKRGFLVENSSLHGKPRCIVEQSVFTKKKRDFTSKRIFSSVKYYFSFESPL